MSYMKHYAMWCQEEGYLDENFESTNPNVDGMSHVEEYHKKNPHMIPPDRDTEEHDEQERMRADALYDEEKERRAGFFDES